ncbi:hypothetical protein AAOE16_10730 [Ekhidna sp. MALMAid0563]
MAERGNQVVFLNPPSKKGYHIFKTKYSNLRVVDYQGFWKGLRFFPKFLRKRNESSVFKRIEKIADLKFDVIWSFDNSVFFDFDALPTSLLKISHIVDLNQDFQTAKASATADICFGVSKDIVKRLSLFNTNSHFINHGLNLKSDTALMPDVPGQNKIKAMYIGNLAMKYLDWAPIYSAVNTHSEVDFIFIGPNKDIVSSKINSTHSYKKQVLEKSNAYFLPPINSKDIDAYLRAADVLFLCYQEQYHHYQSNPHKILEYLYSERPVVASYCAEYDDLCLLSMSKSNKDWKLLFSEVLRDLNELVDSAIAERRRSFALANTYEKQIDKIQKLIDETLS